MASSKRKNVISVIGASKINPEDENLAYSVGKMVAELGCALVCGGLAGAMEFSAKGCRENGGVTIGLLPGKDKEDANEYIDFVLPSTIGFARNAMVAASGDVVVALPGSHGTSSEISYALVYGRPVIDLGSWGREGMIPAADVETARREIIKVLNLDTV